MFLVDTLLRTAQAFDWDVTARTFLPHIAHLRKTMRTMLPEQKYDIRTHGISKEFCHNTLACAFATAYTVVALLQKFENVCMHGKNSDTAVSFCAKHLVRVHVCCRIVVNNSQKTSTSLQVVLATVNLTVHAPKWFSGHCLCSLGAR